ncbi:MAG: outer membrane beta-barrel protein [Acetobacteraceae bacterium]
MTRAVRWIAAASFAAAMPAAYAQTPPPATAPAPTAAPAAEAPPPGLWINGIHFSAQIQGGFTANPATPDSGVNFGRLFDDRANQPLLNQLMLTANKPLDPKAEGFDWGFKLQAFYGSDARYTHFLGIWDQNPGPGYRNQFDVTEANVLLHLPVLTEGGIDVKAGLFTTPIGYETIDPSTNMFYSHSYIFNFGLPLKHTGILTTTHVSPLLDIYLGVDSGINTTIGCCRGDNNGKPGGIIGFGLNMFDGEVTFLALTHIGPENPSRGLAPAFNANKYLRYVSDAYVVWKATDKLTFVTDFNWIRDDFLGNAPFATGNPKPANGFGVAQYMSLALSETVTFNARAEVFRDDNNAFVAAFGNNNDFARVQLGMVPYGPIFFSNKPTTYGAITVGLTIKPELPAPVSGLMIRPELRVDSALNGAKPFKNGNASSAVTFASDFVLTF